MLRKIDNWRRKHITIFIFIGTLEKKHGIIPQNVIKCYVLIEF